ncbi:hypothetical protein IHE45_11G056400 [Dioscorea alata]|uniref:Uncharacterized protein n=1 Tax=Dioscorea alata TaxID=55571 RepID=A0ACB7V6P5_DIOAL|nr:hypothetical protein IHE45_11G056400 [Dioscorea alata]
MITRSNLAEQLREYQIRSKHDWASLSLLSSSSSSSSSTTSVSSRVDVMSVIWELAIFALVVFSAVSLYFRHMRLAFSLMFVATLFYICMKITKQVRQNRKSKRRMLLPLSM